MREMREPISIRRSDLTHVSIHAIPGENEEEQRVWKIAQKAEYSRPRTKWSNEELISRFPSGKRTAEGFMVDNGTMQRVFNHLGYEISRRTLRSNPSGKSSIFDIVSADYSTYDEEGYLIRYAWIEERRVGFVATFEYRTLPDGTKELIRTVEQDVQRAGFINPGKVTGAEFAIDFTDVPLER